MRVWKRMLIILVVVCYNFSALGNYFQYGFVPEVYAAGDDEKVDLVAILVDQSIYGSIQGDLSRYVTQYMPSRATDTKALIFPINSEGFQPKDIYQILENLYLEGEQGVTSQLVGVMILGEVPLPVVEFEGRRFASVFPYTDFNHDDGGTMFVYDPASDLFVFNKNPDSLPEVWHSVIPTNDVSVFTEFFKKLKKYAAAPDEYAKPKVWIEDFPFLKKSYTQEEIDGYVNTLLFGEAQGYRKINTVFSKVLKKEYEDSLLETVQNVENEVDQLAAEAVSDPELEGDPEVQAIAGELVAGGQGVIERADADSIAAGIQDGSDKPIPTKLLEKSLESEFNPIQDIFGTTMITQIQENLLAGGRYQLGDIDLSLEKIATKDKVAKQYLEDMNSKLELALDDQIEDNKYYLMYPLPYQYSERMPAPGMTGCTDLADATVLSQYENHYFGRNAADVLEYPELSIYRGTRYNNTNISDLRNAPLVPLGVENLEDVAGFDENAISVGASYGWLSQQVEQNRAYNFDNALPDKDIYDEFKCRARQDVNQFAFDYRGGASPMNIDTDQLTSNPKYPTTLDEFTSSGLARHPTLNKTFGGPWWDVGGGVLTEEQIDETVLDRYAHHDYGSMITTLQFNQNQIDLFLYDGLTNLLFGGENANRVRSLCRERVTLDHLPEYTSYQEVELFDDTGEWFDGWGVYRNQVPDGGYPGYKGVPEAIQITVHSPTGLYRDIDGDGILNFEDNDMDNDGIPNAEDDDMDGDQIPNGQDYDVDDDGPLYMNGNLDRWDGDIDNDGLANIIDPDSNNDGEPNSEDTNIDADREYIYNYRQVGWIPNTEDIDMDGDYVWDEFDNDIDGDQTPNALDSEMDGDGILNALDNDVDGDGAQNGVDLSCAGGSACNGSLPITDTDADGSVDPTDPDQDGDGIINSEDTDQDGDGVFNFEDNDVDADDIDNQADPDDDNDGTPDDIDETPQGYGTWPGQLEKKGQVGFIREMITPPSAYAQQTCSGIPRDLDKDDIPNNLDRDVDGDTIPNHQDDDIDGDGLLNDEDPDMDCDGVPNGADNDTDGDGLLNLGDGDTNGNQIPNSLDGDIDADGIPNGKDPDVDGDGIPNGDDKDVDGDKVPNDIDDDIDGDGTPNGGDQDMDGDGIINDEDLDVDGDGIPNGQQGPALQGGSPVIMDADYPGPLMPGGYISEWRGPKCFILLRDYKYQLIKTVTKHADPYNEQIDEMNLMTLDRPIDDPRYVTFMGVGGDLVKFIYPDFYRVEVFDSKGALLSADAIEGNIRQYLTDKVLLYNEYLTEQLGKSQEYYGLHAETYDFIEQVDVAATPNREYDLLAPDFLVEQVGDLNIKRIAEQLHYLNIGRSEQRPVGATVGEYQTQARELFNINEKIEYILDDYLQYDTDEFDFDHIAYPTHIDPNLAYEAGLINSDGYDLVGPTDILDSTSPSSAADNPNSPQNVRSVGSRSHPGYQHQSQFAAQDDAACNIDESMGVPLLKYPKAFQCWLERTINNPFEFDLKIEIEWEPELYQQQLETWFNKVSLRSETTPSRLITTARVAPQIGTPRGSFVSQLTMLTPRVRAQDQQGAEDDLWVSSVKIAISDSVFLMIDSDMESEIAIGSLEDLGDLRFTFSAIGTNCPMISGLNICNSPLSLTFNPYNDRTTLPLLFQGDEAATTTIAVDICNQGGDCAEKTLQFYIAPSQLAGLGLSIPTTKLPAGALVPVSAYAYDAYGNIIDYPLMPITLSVDGGYFDDIGPDGTTRDLDSFDQATFLINTSSSQPGDVLTITMDIRDQFTALSGVSQQIPLVDYELYVTDQVGVPIDELVYRLPPESVGFREYNESDESATVRADLLPKLNIVYSGGGEYLSAPVGVTIADGLVTPGRLVVDSQGDEMFVENDTYFIEGQPLDITLFPTALAGEDILQIELPGLSELELPITILPTGPEDISLDIVPGSNDTIEGTIRIHDDRGNVYTEPVVIELECRGGIQPAENPILVEGGYRVFTGTASDAGGCRSRATTNISAYPDLMVGDDSTDGDGGNADGGNTDDSGQGNGNDSDDWNTSGQGDDNANANDGAGDDNGNDGVGSSDGDTTSSGDGDGDAGTNDTGGDGDGDGSDGQGDASASDNKTKDDLTPATERFTNDYESFAEIDVSIDEYLRPQQEYPVDDLNIMYLSLFGKSWGNMDETVGLLKNSKTLGITTQYDDGGSAFPPKIASVIHQDGSVEDLLGIVRELDTDKGEIYMNLGNNGGIGRVLLGTYQDFSIYQIGLEPDEFKPSRLIYTPIGGDGTDNNLLSGNQLFLGGEVMIDFVRGYRDADMYIRLEDPAGGNRWEVRYQNQLVGVFELLRDPEVYESGEIQVYHGSYSLGESYANGSSTSRGSVAILLADHSGQGGDAHLYEAVEASVDPLKNVGTRHNFSNLTNFAQGMQAGPATQHFANPFTMFMGDPFLERVSDNRTILSTRYDDGIGQKIFSDTKDMLDADVFDFNADGLQDIVISYQDGSLRILKNHGGTNPFKDLGMLLVVAPGIRETYVGDVDGNGWDDILIRTKNDKMLAYTNQLGEFDVDGRIVCLDITNGDKNIHQAKQIFAEDMDGDQTLDIITNADGEIKVFYGGGGLQSPNYLSTDAFKCDDDWKSRQAGSVQLVKKYSLTLGGEVQDSSLRHRPGLLPADIDPNSQQFEDDDPDEEQDEPDYETDRRIKIQDFIKTLMTETMAPITSVDVNELVQQGLDEYDFVIEGPDVIRPDMNQGDEEFYVIRAMDTYPDTPRFDVSKQFVDLNGGELEPGDLVEVSVSLVPVGGAIGPIAYREKLSGPWIIYKDEYGHIDPFNYGTLASDTKIDWNIGNGYEFMIYDHQLNGTETFSYTIQYDGKKDLVRIEVETLEEELFRGTASQSVSKGDNTVYAQGGWIKRIRAYPDQDGCHKIYWEFSPGEKLIPLQKYHDDKKGEYEDHCNETREETFNTLTENYNLDPISIMMGILPSIEYQLQDIRQLQLRSEVDLGAEYLNYFVDEFTHSVENWAAGAVQGSLNKMGLFEGYEFGYESCQGVKFGKSTCGQGLPIPFNMAFLSPGTYNIMGKKPSFPQIPNIFPDDKGIPIFAFPTQGTVPTWPIFPNGADGIFGGDTSQIRLYISPTLSNGLGLAICFGPYDLGLEIPSPVGDVVGNCLVIAGAPILGAQCTDGDPVKDTQGSTTAESDHVIESGQQGLYKIGTCDEKLQKTQPFFSSDFGGPIAMGGGTRSVQATILDVEQSYLKGGNPFELKIEGGLDQGLISCILKKRGEKQMRYFANNALNMHMYVLLPNMADLTKNLDQLGNVDQLQSFRFDRKDTREALANIELPGTKSQYDDQTTPNDKRFLPRSVLDALNSDTNNPFEALAQYFENIPLISIEEKVLSVEVPFIYQEDLARYEFYLESWLERNEKIVAGRQAMDTPVESNVVSEMQQAVTSVRVNLQTLREYETLPSKLATMIHAYDQYLIEVYYFVEEFVGELTGWLQVNARRFSQWVDFIVLLVGIIETRQLLIDFSVDWNTKCAKCRQDNYDYYSCKLSLLCVDLPILPIPNFHLPDIYLDMSDIDIGLNIIVPRFNFTPRMLPLIRLPDLPLPTNAEIDLDLPEVPRLPSPPPLPQMPELDLEIDIALPNLPPVPRVPKISPAIKTIVKVADFIGTLFCIFKSGLGLVAEQGVKTRIEQMTQRKNDIFPFDDLKVTFPESPLVGSDYKIESHIDLKFDFRELYDALDQVVDGRHDVVDQAFQQERVFSQTVTDINWAIDNQINELNIPVNPDINIDLDSSTLDQNYFAYTESRDKFLIGGEVSYVQQKIQEGVQYILSRDDLTNQHYLAGKIDAHLSLDHQVIPNIDGVNDVGEQVIAEIQQQRQENATIQQQIKEDFDGFLDSLEQYQLVSNENPIRDYPVALFEGNQETIDLLQSQDDPLSSYINMHKPVIDGYVDTLQSTSHYELQMSYLEHETLSNFFGDLQNKISQYNGEQVFVAQSAGGGGISSSISTNTDYSQFIEGFFMPGNDGEFHNVIARDKGDDLYRANDYEIVDINGDGLNDIFLIENNTLYLKYGDQVDEYPGSDAVYREYIEIGPFADMDALIEAVKPNDGWYTVGGAKYKLRDHEWSALEYKRQGHNFQSMSLTWINDPTVPGYVIELSDRVDFNHQKQRKKDSTRYVVALPSTIYESNLTLELPDQVAKRKISALIDQDIVIEVLPYDGDATNVEILLAEYDKQWLYTKVAPLSMSPVANTNNGLFSFLRKEPGYDLKKVGPWSRQRLVGAQNFADEALPSWDIKLIRDINGDIQSEGVNLHGYINTVYTLEALASDNGEVIESWVIYSGNVLKHEDGPEIILEDLDYKYEHIDRFLFVAVDQAGNIGQEEVLLNITTPTLEIKKIDYQGVGAEITAELEHDLDYGQIRFQKERHGYWEDLNPATYTVVPEKVEYQGGLYTFDTDIALTDSAGNKIGDVDSQRGQIEISADAADQYTMQVDFDKNGSPQVQVVDQSNGQSIFGVSIKSDHIPGGDIGDDTYLLADGVTKLEQLEGVELLHGGYQIVELNAVSLREYLGGYCVRPVNDECHIYVSSQGDVTIPPPFNTEYQATYRYDELLGYGEYTIALSTGQPVVIIRFIPQPFQ